MSGLKVTPEQVKLAHIHAIIGWSKCTIDELRKVNKELEKTYQGKELTKQQLIYQIIYKQDAPKMP